MEHTAKEGDLQNCYVLRGEEENITLYKENERDNEMGNTFLMI